MKVRSGLPGTRRTVLLIETLLASIVLAPAALAADASVPVAAVDLPSGYEFHGDIEAGGRAFIQRPPDGPSLIPGLTGTKAGATSLKESRAKFEEYGALGPGLFLEYLYAGLHSRDGVYSADFWAKNVGANNQTYLLDLTKAGEHYFTFGWDQSPQLSSTSAKSIFGGSPFALTVDPVVRAGLQTAVMTPAQNTTVANTIINNNVRSISLGIQRDRASAQYKWTPTPDTEVRVEYSHERRTGNIETGVTFSSSPSLPAAQVPKPIADTTQNASVSYQYTGTSVFNLPWTANVRYNASIYQDDANSFTLQNPFATVPITTAALGGCCAFTDARYSLAPSNNAQSIAGTTGIDLPFKTRYMGTFAYTMMRQDEAFIPMTINPGPIVATVVGGTATTFGPIPAMPRGSLDGRINTVLTNNVLTTQITPELKSKFTFRYYSVDNRTPPLTLAQWVLNDTRLASNTNASYAPHSTQYSSYVKQNFAEELNWRPVKWLNAGAGYTWERYERDLANTNVTNEKTGKVYADVSPAEWVKIRSSYSYSARRFENYDYTNYVFAIIAAGAGAGGIQINPLMRTFDQADRNRNKANVFVDFNIGPSLVITPTFGLRNDHYLTTPTNPSNQLGLTQDDSWNAGIEVSYTISPGINVMGSYTYEKYARTYFDGGGIVNPPTNMYQGTVDDRVNTFLAAINVELIPKILDLKLSYTHAWAIDHWGQSAFGPSPASAASLSIPYPDNTTTYQRFDAVAKYKFDEDVVRKLGWNGEAYAKVRYLYERNRVSNWQIDNMQPYMFFFDSSRSKQIWMAGDNPNYTAQVIVASLGFKW